MAHLFFNFDICIQIIMEGFTDCRHSAHSVIRSSRIGLRKSEPDRTFRVAEIAHAAGATSKGELTVDSPAIPHIIPDSKIVLLEHQTRTVARMRDIESMSPITMCTAALLADPVGSGKTWDILALLSLGDPPPSPSYQVYNDVMFSKYYDNQIDATLIFASKAAIAQWDLACRSLRKRHYTITNFQGFEHIYYLVKSGNPLPYSVIIVKNGSITADMSIPELSSEFVCNKRNILAMFGIVYANYQFSRVVLDDFDVMRNLSSLVVPARFTWYVSTTTFESSEHAKQITYISPYTVMNLPLMDYASLLHDHAYPRVRCTDAFIKTSINMSAMIFWRYMHILDGVDIVAALGDMGRGDVAEMINADAVRSAAMAAGGHCNSTADIFRKILADNHSTYVSSQKRKIKLAGMLAQQIALDDYEGVNVVMRKSRQLKKDERLAKTSMQTVHSCIVNLLPKKLAKISLYRNDDVLGAIKLAKTEAETDFARVSQTIARVQSRFSDGECPITAEPLASCKNIFILSCCNIVLSDACFDEGYTTFRRGVGNRITGNCPQCRAAVTNENFISMRPEAMAAVIAGDYENEENLDTAGLPKVMTVEDGDGVKYETFVKIYENKPTIRNNMELTVPGVICSGKDMGTATKDERKYLVIANHKATFNKLIKYLAGDDRKYSIIQGHASQIARMVEQYQLPNSDPNSIEVLLINDPRMCASLNLQNTTDIVFWHWISNYDLLIQYLGRGARHGRKRNLHVHWLLYQNESVHGSHQGTSTYRRE